MGPHEVAAVGVIIKPEQLIGDVFYGVIKIEAIDEEGCFHAFSHGYKRNPGAYAGGLEPVPQRADKL